MHDGYRSPMPERLRWSNWAADPEGITGEELTDFVNNDLFPSLKGLSVSGATRTLVVRDVFEKGAPTVTILYWEHGVPEGQKAAHSNTGIPVLAMGNIQNGAIIRKEEKRLTETSTDLPTLYLEKFDLLYNRTNSAELVGKTGIYLGKDDCLTFASYLIRIRLTLEFISPIYVNLAMNAPYFRATQDRSAYQKTNRSSQR